MLEEGENMGFFKARWAAYYMERPKCGPVPHELGYFRATSWMYP